MRGAQQIPQRRQRRQWGSPRYLGDAAKDPKVLSSHRASRQIRHSPLGALVWCPSQQARTLGPHWLLGPARAGPQGDGPSRVDPPSRPFRRPVQV